MAGEEGIREVERSSQEAGLVDRKRHMGALRRALLRAIPQRRQLQCARLSPISLYTPYLPLFDFAGKDTPPHRLAHILRPIVTRPDLAARATLATPPPTDLDFS